MPSNPHKNFDHYSKIILDNINEGVFTIDATQKITTFNTAAERITGIPREEAIGQLCYNVFRSNICETECALCKTMQTGEPISEKMVYIIDASGEQIPISISTAMLRTENGKIIGGIEIFRDLTLVDKLRKEIEGNYSFADIISKNREMQLIFDILPQIAESGSIVLVEGESGTGKELFARVIHDLSKRKKHKLVAVNCGALPDTLLESELFGYKAGAFTDAKRDKKGRIAQAEGGTILLDEIGDISPAFQVRLLRFLQDKTYEPLGSTESVVADVRVIAATNKNLQELVEKGLFRQDLFYRINIIKITIPPLRDRREDIPHLVKHFIAKHNRILGKNITGIAPRALDILMRHNYPGNVRELENIIERALVLCRNKVLEPQNLPLELQPSKDDEHLPVESLPLKELEKQSIMKALKHNNWNRQAAAAELHIHKTTLFRKIKQLGIKLPGRDGRSKSSSPFCPQ
ncbi:MAG: sigma 54-interacting transcriptional regulator [Deferribacteres bacterium]|nr:sigma 54-interacting transcriptional regulator [candidate division KSB1 bacterium]MCB9500599.1 sigma 54-interacting transcriptional regulator [Deferribacteres bacterium]